MPERLLLINRDRYPRMRYLIKDSLDVARNAPTEILSRLFYERPSASFRRRLSGKMDQQFMAHADTLVRQGVLILEEYFRGDHLTQMQQDFDSWCATKPIDGNGFK